MWSLPSSLGAFCVRKDAWDQQKLISVGIAMFGVAISVLFREGGDIVRRVISCSEGTEKLWMVICALMFALCWYSIVQNSDKAPAIESVRAKKRAEVEDLMRAVLAYTDAEETKRKENRKMPEARRLFHLLWDVVSEKRTTSFGIPQDSCLNVRIEDLFVRVHKAELEQALERTRQALEFRPMNYSEDCVNGGSITLNALTKLEEYESGEKLKAAIDFAKEVKENLGERFSHLELELDAKNLLKGIAQETVKLPTAIWQFIGPLVPFFLLTVALDCAQSSMQAIFHCIGIWAAAVEVAATGDYDGACALLFRIWFAHMIIKVIEMTKDVFQNKIRTEFAESVSRRVLSAMLRQDYEYFDKTPVGVLQDRLNRDAAELGDNLLSFPQQMFSKLTSILVNMALVYGQSPTNLFLAAIVPIVFMIGFQYYMFRMHRKSEKIQHKISVANNASMSEILQQVKTVRQFVTESRASAKYDQGIVARNATTFSHFFWRRLSSLATWCYFDSSIAIMMLIGLPHVSSGAMSASGLIDVWSKLNFDITFRLREAVEQLPRFTQILSPVGRICELLQASPKIEPLAEPTYIDVKTIEDFKCVLAHCETLRRPDDPAGVQTVLRGLPASTDICCASNMELLPAPGAQLTCLKTRSYNFIEVKDPADIAEEQLMFPVRMVFSTKLRPVHLDGHIEFRDVHFSYPSDLRKPILQGLSFCVEPGQKVALVGTTGCGKSSCMALLQRLYNPLAGDILIDGICIQKYDLHFLRSHMVIVDQNTVLFNMSIRDNIAYGVDASEEKIIEACKEAKAWDFIAEMPDQLMTMITSGGSNLSGGQRQRLAIARAIVRKPDVILLDEATSALDNENEAMVQESLDQLAKKGSALVIAHRLSTIRDSDVIVVMDKGTVVEQGTHDELLGSQCSAPETHTNQAEDMLKGWLADLTRTSSEPQEKKDALSPSLDKVSTLMELQFPRVSKVTGLYKRIWAAANGSSKDTMSFRQLGQKIEQLENEILEYKARWEPLQQVKASLQRNNGHLDYISQGESVRRTISAPVLEMIAHTVKV